MMNEKERPTKNWLLLTGEGFQGMKDVPSMHPSFEDNETGRKIEVDKPHSVWSDEKHTEMYTWHLVLAT